MEIKFGYVVFDKNDINKEILHFVGYQNKPTEEDKNQLKQELIDEQEEFGLSSVIYDIEIEEADEETVIMYNNYING